MPTAMMPARSIPEFYPGFVRAGSFFDAPESWIGTLRPLARCGPDDLSRLVDDLVVGARVCVANGCLSHDPSCRRDHQVPRFMNRLDGITAATFRVRMLVWPAPVHPKMVAVYPEISSTVFPNHPHLFRTRQPIGLGPSRVVPDALCTYRPGDGEWSRNSGDLVLFLDFASIYLAKHAIWVRTGADRSGIWIGPQASHEPTDLIREMSPTGECRCGSGRMYRVCCRTLDLLRADREGIIRFVRSIRGRPQNHVGTAA